MRSSLLFSASAAVLVSGPAMAQGFKPPSGKLDPTTMVGTTPLSTAIAQAAAALPASGGNASGTMVTASGTPTSRSVAGRAADEINVMDYGAKGDDNTDDSAAINAATAYARTLTQGVSNQYAQTNGPYAYVLFPSGHRWKITHPVNFTGFQSNGIRVVMTGSSIDCHVPGGICVDAIGSNELRFDNVSIVGDVTDTPKIGLQIGRTNTYLTADNHTFANLVITGAFTFTGLYDFAAETTTFLHPEIWNYGGAPGSYAMVLDDYNHFGLTSSFQTINAAADTPSSFNETLFVGADIRGGVGQTVPMWLGGTSRMSMIRSYAAGGGTSCAPTCFGAVIFNEGGVYNTMLHMDTHFETSGLTDVFDIQGDSSQAIYGFEYLDQGPQASNSVFKLAPNITYVEGRAFDLNIAGYAIQGAKLLDAPTIWRLAGHYSSQGFVGFNATSFFQGLMDIGSSEQQVAYGSAAIQAQFADGAALGGGARGVKAVDMQLDRSAAGQVASGMDSTVSGGGGNTASSSYATVPGGNGNVASGPYSLAAGVNTKASGNFTTALGANSVASDDGSTSIGVDATDRGNRNTLTLGNTRISALGDNQASWSVWKGKTTNTTPLRLTSDASAAYVTGGTSNCLYIPPNTAYGLTITVQARDVTTAFSSYLWKMDTATLLQANAAANTSIALGTPAVVAVGTTSGASVSAAADATLGCLNLTWTAPNTDTWDVVAKIESAQVQ